MATRGLSSDELKLRAQRAFDKVDARKQEASRALEAEQLAREAVLQKTARLRALRLAKEAADAETAAIVAAEQARPKPKSPRPRPPRRRARPKPARAGRRPSPPPDGSISDPFVPSEPFLRLVPFARGVAVSSCAGFPPFRRAAAPIT